ncbi:IclR family transcriptional regulator [Nocardia pseudovaccinii]|uniref:IclR family transcriptional regulator n=1 Tax=Nocardia pseudovaccinii TaxID=189540 RepID=UPI003D921F88
MDVNSQDRVSHPNSQTLSRGVAVLRAVARNPQGLSATELAVATDLNRTVVHRLIQTLVSEGFVERTDEGLYVPGLELQTLVGVGRPAVIDFSRPLLQRLADRHACTAVLYFDDVDSVVAAAVAVPATSDVYLAYRPGSHHPRDRGSAGYAILATKPPSDDDPAGVIEARRRGWAATSGHIVPHAHAAAVPIPGGGSGPDCCIMVVSYDQQRVQAAVADLLDDGRLVGAFIRGRSPMA